MTNNTYCILCCHYSLKKSGVFNSNPRTKKWTLGIPHLSFSNFFSAIKVFSTFLSFFLRSYTFFHFRPCICPSSLHFRIPSLIYFEKDNWFYYTLWKTDISIFYSQVKYLDIWQSLINHLVETAGKWEWLVVSL